MLRNNLKNILDEKGLKANYIAKKLNIYPSYFSSIINGKHIPSVELALHISTILGVPVNKLFYFEKESMNNP